MSDHQSSHVRITRNWPSLSLFLFV